MKKLLLSGIIILFISCEKKYSMERCYYGGEFKTYILYKKGYVISDIVKSWSINIDSISEGRIKKDSIEAVNLIKTLNNIKP